VKEERAADRISSRTGPGHQQQDRAMAYAAARTISVQSSSKRSRIREFASPVYQPLQAVCDQLKVWCPEVVQGNGPGVAQRLHGLYVHCAARRRVTETSCFIT
jgi:hypothetical protein